VFLGACGLRRAANFGICAVPANEYSNDLNVWKLRRERCSECQDCLDIGFGWMDGWIGWMDWLGGWNNTHWLGIKRGGMRWFTLVVHGGSQVSEGRRRRKKAASAKFGKLAFFVQNHWKFGKFSAFLI